MRYINNWEKVKKRHTAFWNGERDGGCLCHVTAPKDNARYVDYPFPSSPEDRLKWWTDSESVIKRTRTELENTYYAGDAFPLIRHDLGAAGHAGFFEGAKPHFDTSIWFKPSLEDYSQLKFDPHSFLYERTISMTEDYVHDSGGEYIVSTPDVVSCVDVLSHLRGPENFMMDLLENPDEVKAALAAVQKVWEDVATKTYGIARENNDGGSCVAWLATWAPGFHWQLQCDMSVMISADMFKEFCMYEIKAQTDYLEYPLYHFDGEEQEPHLEHLLGVEKLRVIQWTNIAGRGPAVDYLPILRRIQKAGKSLIIDSPPHLIPTLMENLQASKMYIRTRADSPVDADDIVKMIARLSRD